MVPAARLRMCRLTLLFFLPSTSRLLGRLRLFRYEVRCWRDGSIPDLAEAVGGARRLSTDPRAARRVLAALPVVPTPVWGRDELGAGEGWNSNSMVAWVLATAGVPTRTLRPPARGRAPGWDAGLAVARRGRRSRRADFRRRPTMVGADRKGRRREVAHALTRPDASPPPRRRAAGR